MCRFFSMNQRVRWISLGCKMDQNTQQIATINRFSSRRQRLDHAFLADRLRGAKSYNRIAGYFRSSIFELVGEEIASIPKVRIVCNSELDAADVAVSKHVRETALKERWNEAPVKGDVDKKLRNLTGIQ